jgi:DNA replication protein DnaC
VLFASAPALLADLVKAHAEGRFDERLAFYTKPKQLIIDELGYLPFDSNAVHLFFQLVSRRYERGSLVVTSNRSVGEWGTVLGDPVAATAILDRLLHHSHVVTIRVPVLRPRGPTGTADHRWSPTRPGRGDNAGSPASSRNKGDGLKL